MRRIAGLAGCLLIGCTSAESITASLPQEEGYIALVRLDADGRVGSASELLELSADGSTPFVATDEPAHLLFFRSEALAPYAALLAKSGSGRLRQAEPCEPALPTPDWVGLFEEDHVVELESIPDLGLTSDALASVCPDLDEAEIFAQTCDSVRCSPSISSRNGCSLEVDFEACDLGSATLQVDARARVCSVFDKPLGCEPEILLELERPGPPFSVDRISFFDGDFYIHPRLKYDVLPEPTPAVLFSGYATDLSVLDDRVVVVAMTGNQHDPCPLGFGEPTTLYSIDKESMEILGSKEGPACLTRIAPDPLGDGFVGTYLEMNAVQIARFDSSGTVLQRDTLPLSSDDGIVGVHALSDRIVIVSFLSSEDRLQHDNRIIYVDALDLGLLSVRELPGASIWASHLDGDAALLLPSLASSSLLVVDAISGDTVRETPVEGAAASGTLFDVYRHGPSETDLLATVGPNRVVTAGKDRRGTAVADPVLDGFPLTFATALHEEDLVFVSTLRLGESLEWTATLRELDPSEGRFGLGRWDIGGGAITKMAEDDEGRLWLLLPWTAEVVRLSALR